MAISASDRYLAFTHLNGTKLKIVDLETLEVRTIAPGVVGPSFAWSPKGFRLFYREIERDSKHSMSSFLKAYDLTIKKSLTLDSWIGQSGYLALDPRDQKLQILTPDRVISRRIILPDFRKFRNRKKLRKSRWIPTPISMLQLSADQKSLRSLEDDRSGIHSFAIHPQSTDAIWSTKDGGIYYASGKKPVKFITYGKDPRWHPGTKQMVYSHAIRVGTKVIGYDLRIIDLASQKAKFLTATRSLNERWPTWNTKGDKIFYTIEKTTDLFQIRFQQ